MKKKFIERNLALFYGIHSEKIREILPISVAVELEKIIGERRVDLYFEEEGYNIYIEVQSRKSDNTHLKQIQEIIKTYELKSGTIIAWIATDFYPKHLEAVQETLNNSKKNLEFYAIKVNKNLVSELDKYSSVDGLLLIDKLTNLIKFDKTTLHRKICIKKKLPNNPPSNIEFSDEKAELVKSYIKEIRSQIPNWINAYYAKVMTSNEKLYFGGGISDLTFAIGTDRYNELTVTLIFMTGQLPFFRALYKCRHIIDSDLSPTPKWNIDKNKLSYSIPFTQTNKEESLKKQVAVLKTYLEFFHPLIKNRDLIVASSSKPELEEIMTSLLR